ncbi:hypothetical protein [Paludisphaera sp.]|uniref:hypothetical protein n=1 Tax=Paludisphaera sp. TaxID=2017432 RepID=UPI00301E2D90
MTDETPEPSPAAPADPGAAGASSDPDFDDPGSVAATKARPGWRDGLRDMARGAEFGVWSAILLSTPVVCAMVGGSLGVLIHAGSGWRSIAGLAAFAGRWAGIILVCSIPVAPAAGLMAWLYRGIARRLGSPGPDRARRRRGRRRRWAAVAGLGLLGLVAGVAAGHFLTRASIGSLEEAVAETDAIDPDWRLDDLLANRDEVPDDENSAFVAAEVIGLLPDPWPPRPRPEGVPGETDALDFAAALDRAQASDDSRRLDEATASALRAEMEALVDALDVARTLVDYDRGRHELEIGPQVIDTLLRETQDTRAVAMLLYADALLLAQDGELDAALDSCRALVALARSIGDEPFLISQLVRMAVNAQLEGLARRVLGQGEPSDEALAALQELLEDEREQPRLWWGLRGERAMLVEMIRRVQTGEIPLEDLVRNGSLLAPRADGVNVAVAVACNYQMAFALRWFNEALTIPSLPEDEWDATYAPLGAEIVAVRGSRFGKFTMPFIAFMMPAASRAIDAEKRIRAVFGSLIILIAAERQRQATGKWPASVADIDPDILPDPPLDPYTGEPYRMHHADGLLKIHTLGPNKRDEGGAYDFAKWRHKEKLGRDDVGTYAHDPERRGRPAEEGEEVP